MAVVMRLTRLGATHRPFYRVVVADRRSPRDGRFIEVVGAYRPLYADDHPERTQFHEDRVRHWLAQGAKPSPRVARLLGKAKLAPVPAIPDNPKKAAPKKKAQEKSAAASASAEAASQEAPAQDAPAQEAAPETATPEEKPDTDDAARGDSDKGDTGDEGDKPS